MREILRVNRAYDASVYLVLASQSVIDRLLDEESASVADLEEFIAKTIRFQVEIMYSQERCESPCNSSLCVHQISLLNK